MYRAPPSIRRAHSTDEPGLPGRELVELGLTTATARATYVP